MLRRAAEVLHDETLIWLRVCAPTVRQSGGAPPPLPAVVVERLTDGQSLVFPDAAEAAVLVSGCIALFAHSTVCEHKVKARV